MVTGLLALLLSLTIITRALDLKVLNVLMNQMFGVLALSLVVIFQPELRRMLAELGTLSVFTNAQQQRESIEDIVQTADRLSPVRIGALIAIAPPVDRYEFASVKMSEKPKFIVHGEEDELISVKTVRQFYAALPEPKELVVIDRANHLFDGQARRQEGRRHPRRVEDLVRICVANAAKQVRIGEGAL